MAWLWLILAFAGNFTGFSLLKRIPKFKQSFGAKEHEWLVNAVWDVAQQFVPFMLICNLLLGPRSKDRIKDSVLLNAFLTFICLAVPAVIEHLVEYPEFQIDVKNVEQHNSLQRIELFAAFSFASSSFGLSKVYDLTFESGFFSLCLGYAMTVSLEVVDKNGNRYTAFILVTYLFCFLVILLRKYLEKNKGNDITRQRNYQSSDNCFTNDENQNSNDEAGQNPSTSSNTNDLQGGHTEPTGRSALHRHNQNPINDQNGNLNRDSSMGDIESGPGNTREESWDINEQNWETVPPKLYSDTSSNSGEEDNDDIITQTEISNYSAEGSSSTDDHVGKIKEREVPDQEIGPEKREMGSSTSSGHMKLGGSSGFGGCEKDDAPLLPRSNNINDGETQIANTGLHERDRSKDQSQESRSQSHEINENPLSPKSSLKVYGDDVLDHEPFDGEGSNGNDFRSKTGCMLGVDLEENDSSQESDCLEKENVRPLREGIPSASNSGADTPICLHKSKKEEVDPGQMEGNADPHDGINDEGIRKPFFDEGTRKPSNDDPSDNEDEGDDDFNSGAGCKQIKGGKDIITNLHNLRSASRRSDDEGSYGLDLNNRTACEVRVGQIGRNKCPVKEGKDIIISNTEISNRFAEGTSANDDCVGKIEEIRGDAGQEIGHEEAETRSSTPSSHMKIAGSTEFGGYEKDDVPPLSTKSDNIIDGETQVVKVQIKIRKHRRKKSDSNQDYQLDDNPLLHKDQSESKNVEVDLGQIEGSGDTQHEISYEGIRELFSYEETNKPSDDPKDDSFDDDEGNDGDDFNSKAGCKFGRGEKNERPLKKGRDITNLDESCAKKKKQVQTIRLKTSVHCVACERKMKRALVKLRGVDSVAINIKQQEVTVTGNIEANLVVKKMASMGKYAEILPNEPYKSACYAHAAPANYDKKAPPGYVTSVEGTATVGMPASAYDMKAPPSYVRSIKGTAAVGMPAPPGYEGPYTTFGATELDDDHSCSIM